jgi:hypothetical protein
MIDGFEDVTSVLTEREWRGVPTICSMLRKTTPGQVIPARVLSAAVGWTGMHGQARVRRVVHVLRVTGEVRWLCADSRGYWKAQTADEVRSYLVSLDQRIASIAAVRSALRGQLDDQLSLAFVADGGRP